MAALSRSGVIAAPAERVFAYVDDIHNLAGHMSESRSVPMMGSKLALEITSPQSTGLGATYRYSGRMMGLTIDFSETVIEYIAGRKKVWRTIGRPRLLIIDGYEMQVLVDPLAADAARLTIAIDYALPPSGFWRLAGWLLANAYSGWCLNSMVQGTKRDLEQQHGQSHVTREDISGFADRTGGLSHRGGAWCLPAGISSYARRARASVFAAAGVPAHAPDAPWSSRPSQRTEEQALSCCAC